MLKVDCTYLIDKPTDWTSFDCVAKLRNEIKKQTGKREKVGHSGTLDPFATGLLILLVGKETKNQANYMKLDKEYIADLFLGAESTTGDPEGEISLTEGVKELTLTRIEKELKSFIGEIDQVPPIYSAIKVNGKPAYKLARNSETVELKSRKVTIYNINIISFDWPKLTLQVRCSSGTYIRSLARDLGQTLGCKAYLTALRRTRIGSFTLDEAKSLDNIT
jgi:tRNA pseudouridine55 synthase